MVPLAIAMFLGLFLFSEEVLGIHTGHAQMQLGLFAAFVLGILCGYKLRN